MENDSIQPNNGLSNEFIRMYYDHQFDRMGKLENQRLMISNIVITISVLAFSFGFGKLSDLTVINGLGLPALMIFSNLFAIAYINRASRWISVHRMRAKDALERYAPELQRINESSPWIKGGLLGSRRNIQNWLHVLLLITALIPVIVYLKQLI